MAGRRSTRSPAPRGKVIDDGTLHRFGEDNYRLTSADPNIRWLHQNARGMQVQIEDASERVASLSLQGPLSRTILERAIGRDLASLKYFRLTNATIGDVAVVISRTGYTGEDGFEIYLSPDDAPRVWRRLVEAGATPAGLGARDTLRLEAGMCLYGNELDAKTTPLEAGISFAVHLDKEPRFIGQRALLLEDTEGLRKKLVGFEMEGRGIARHGHHVTSGAEIVGEVTSGTKSPTLEKAIGLALVDPGVEDRFEIVIRDNPVPAKTVPLPFYKRDRG